MNNDENKTENKKKKKTKFKLIEGNSENNVKDVYPNRPLFIKAAVMGKRNPDVAPIYNDYYCKYCNGTGWLKLRKGIIKCGCLYPDRFVFIIDTASYFVGVDPHILKYWEVEFDIIQSVQNPLGDKFYRLKDMENFSLIKSMLYDDGLTIQQAKMRLPFVSR